MFAIIHRNVYIGIQSVSKLRMREQNAEVWVITL